jgi:hypothetical protein
MGQAVAQLVKALGYKPEDLGFDSRLGIYDFSLTSCRIMALRSNQPQTGLRTTRISLGYRRAGA